MSCISSDVHFFHKFFSLITLCKCIIKPISSTHAWCFNFLVYLLALLSYVSVWLSKYKKLIIVMFNVNELPNIVHSRLQTVNNTCDSQILFAGNKHYLKVHQGTVCCLQLRISLPGVHWTMKHREDCGQLAGLGSNLILF